MFLLHHPSLCSLQKLISEEVILLNIRHLEYIYEYKNIVFLNLIKLSFIKQTNKKMPMGKKKDHFS